MLDSPVLILNSGMIPINILNVKSAIILQLLKKAVSIKSVPDKFICSQKMSIKLPRVISLIKYHKIPKKHVIYSRLNVIYRDDMQCAYCGNRFPINQLTIDHVVPQSRWESVPKRQKPKLLNCWQNTVTACKICNYKKGNKLLSETKMKLLIVPKEPKYMPYLVITKKSAEKYGWMEFLTHNVKIIEAINT